MKSSFSISSFLVLMSLITSSAYASKAPTTKPETDGWELLSTEDGIRIWKKEIPGSPLVAFKGEGLVPASITKVASVVMDTTRAKEWVDSLEESRIVRMVSPSEFIEYDHIGTPVVMKDRDFVSLVKSEANPKERTLVVTMTAIKDPSIPPTGYVRGELLNSKYVMKAIDENTTLVTGEIHADPKGSVPKWVVNLFQKDWPRNTIQALRKQASKSDIKELVEYRSLLNGDDTVVTSAAAPELPAKAKKAAAGKAGRASKTSAKKPSLITPAQAGE